uniref:Ig-like domain-containing protein n=1 Tax=Pundamilia nyererei TaxID=303518 RepID=A0A3B4H0N0_9CICH
EHVQRESGHRAVLHRREPRLQREQAHFRLGDALVLQPVPPVTKRITSVVWKRNNDLLAEWAEGESEVRYYGGLRGRSELSTGTGRLRVSAASAEDAGVFSVEINNEPQSELYRAAAVDEVPQPEAFVTPLACSQASSRCLLHCYGHTADTEDITYYWKMGDGEWEESEKKIEILNVNELHHVRTFSCRMKDPVSEKDSDRNPIGSCSCTFTALLYFEIIQEQG